MKNGLFQLALLVTLAAVTTAQTCNSTMCDRNVNCVGFANQICNNATVFYTGAVCLSASHCSSYTQTNGDFSVQLSGQPPNVIHNYYSVIKQAIISAYNDYCVKDNNYLICCPGSSDWPNKATQQNKTAMASESEVLILSAYGDSSKAVLAIRLAPSDNSSLCTAVTYTTTTSTTTTTTSTTVTTATTAATAANTTMAAATTTTAAAAANTTMAAATTTTAATVAAASSSSTAATVAAASSSSTAATVAAASSSSTAATVAAASSSSTAATVAAASSSSTAATASAASSSSTAATVAAASSSSTETAVSAASSSSTAPSGRRRKREVNFDSLMAEEKADDSDFILHRSRRAALTLSVSAISAISSSIQISQVIQTALSNNNITVTVTVTAVGVTSQSLASQLECSRLVASCAAALVMTIFSLRR